MIKNNPWLWRASAKSGAEEIAWEFEGGLIEMFFRHQKIRQIVRRFRKIGSIANRLAIGALRFGRIAFSFLHLTEKVVSLRQLGIHCKSFVKRFLGFLDSSLACKNVSEVGEQAGIQWRFINDGFY